MALVLADRVKETTTTTGTGTVTLLGAATGFQSFAAVGNANTTYYTIAAQTSTEWEVGIGTYTSSGTTLSRTTVLSSSNSGNLVDFTAGTKDVFVTYPSSRSVYADGTTLKATNNSILPVANGGTNASTASITSFNNITGYSAAGATGTTTTNLVFSTSPTLVTPILGTPQSVTLTSATGLPLTTGVTGTLPIANGGTNSTSAPTAGGAVYGTGTAYAITAAGTSGQVLTSNGASAPTFQTSTAASKSYAQAMRILAI